MLLKSSTYSSNYIVQQALWVMWSTIEFLLQICMEKVTKDQDTPVTFSIQILCIAQIFKFT